MMCSLDTRQSIGRLKTFLECCKINVMRFRDYEQGPVSEVITYYTGT